MSVIRQFETLKIIFFMTYFFIFIAVSENLPNPSNFIPPSVAISIPPPLSFDVVKFESKPTQVA